MSDKPHVETTPETLAESPEQAADLASLENLAEDIGGPGLQGEGGRRYAGTTDDTDKGFDFSVGVVGVRSIAPAWEITSNEQGQLADAYALVVDKYFPDGVPMGPEVGALLITAAIVMPRLGQPLKVEPETETEKAA